MLISKVRVMFKIRFSKSADKAIKKCQKSNPRLYNQVWKLVRDIAMHPRTGLGHPEALRGGGDVEYSRRVSAHDRLIYKIIDDEVVVLIWQFEGHYDDK